MLQFNNNKVDLFSIEKGNEVAIHMTRINIKAQIHEPLYFSPDFTKYMDFTTTEL